MNSKREHRCPLHLSHHHRLSGEGLSRRAFLERLTVGSALVGSGVLQSQAAPTPGLIQPNGPASRYKPKIAMCFLRRKGPYGLWWPGQIFDGERARQEYLHRAREAEKRLGIHLLVREEPLYTVPEFERWLEEMKQRSADGMLIVLLDRHGPVWGALNRAVQSGIPLVVFMPLGTAFTINTARYASTPGPIVCMSTDDFRQAEFGLKALAARARLARLRCLVLRGNRRYEQKIPQLDLTLHYVPARRYIELYQKTPVDDRMRQVATQVLRGAAQKWHITEQDVLNGVKAYFVAGKLLEEEECDAITMDCLGALGSTKLSLPCLAWSMLNDDQVPAACEADIGAVASHCIVQYLLDRPGFQQDPVPETMENGIIGSHCSCPTRLNGFGASPEPYKLMPHHAMRDATRRTLWREGQRVTVIDVMPGSAKKKTQIWVGTGTVVRNIAVPPAGGCVVAVLYKIDGLKEPETWPGFHQVFFYGDFRREIKQFARLAGLEAVEV